MIGVYRELYSKPINTLRGGEKTGIFLILKKDGIYTNIASLGVDSKNRLKYVNNRQYLMFIGPYIIFIVE